MGDEQTVKCPICGEPYKVYSWFAGDQSTCPACIRKAERAEKADRIIDFLRKNT